MRANDYTGLDYLLRKEKLGDRVEKAINWKQPVVKAANDGLSLGVLGALKQALRDV
jgi:hypothetical protein